MTIKIYYSYGNGDTGHEKAGWYWYAETEQWRSESDGPYSTRDQAREAASYML